MEKIILAFFKKNISLALNGFMTILEVINE